MQQTDEISHKIASESYRDLEKIITLKCKVKIIESLKNETIPKMEKSI